MNKRLSIILVVALLLSMIASVALASAIDENGGEEAVATTYVTTDNEDTADEDATAVSDVEGGEIANDDEDEYANDDEEATVDGEGEEESEPEEGGADAQDGDVDETEEEGEPEETVAGTQDDDAVVTVSEDAADTQDQAEASGPLVHVLPKFNVLNVASVLGIDDGEEFAVMAAAVDEEFAVMAAASEATDDYCPVTGGAHDWDENSKCVECGYVCSHTSTQTWLSSGDENVAPATYRDIGSDSVHIISVERFKNTECATCGKIMKSESAGLVEVEEQHGYDGDGVCNNCGHKNTCAHVNTVTETYSLDGNPYGDDDDFEPEWEDAGEEGHYTTSYWRTIVTCKDCGQEIKSELSGIEKRLEEHAYEDGACWKCDRVNTCTHAEKTTIEDVDYDDYVEIPGDDDSHRATKITWRALICAICGEVLEQGETAEPNAVVAHTYSVNGICVECGHKKPEATATPAPTATPAATAEPMPTVEPAQTIAPTEAPAAETEAEPEPEVELVYEPVSEDTEINGIKVADEPTLAEAIETIGENLDAENVTVTIPGIEKVLDTEELNRFDQLSVKDRLMVALTALGFGDVFQNADDAMSEEAQALAADIAGRLAQLSPDELQALTALIAESFPRENVTIDGQEYEGFTIELVIDRDGEQTFERYTFYNDGAQWILYSIEVGEYKVVE